MTAFLKVSIGLFSSALIGASLFFATSTTTQPVALQDSGIKIPEDAMAIIEKKCMGCHKPDSRNTKAKEKLIWADIPKMDKEEQEHLVDELFEVLEDGKMPPKKALERRPQMKLTDDETKVLLTWVESEEKRLKGY